MFIYQCLSIDLSEYLKIYQKNYINFADDFVIYLYNKSNKNVTKDRQ